MHGVRGGPLHRAIAPGDAERARLPDLRTEIALSRPVAQGQRFGRLTVLRQLEADGGKQGRRWLCLCDCGRLSRPRAKDLAAGNSRSCGCGRGRAAQVLTARTQLVLAAIGRSGGRLQQALLPHIIGATPPWISRAVGRLVAAGLVRKIRRWRSNVLVLIGYRNPS